MSFVEKNNNNYDIQLSIRIINSAKLFQSYHNKFGILIFVSKISKIHQK